jgi:hypothetical protein
LGGDYSVRIEVLESHGFIQPNRGRQHAVGLQIESLRARISRFFDRRMKQPATDSGSLVRGLDSHFCDLKFFVSDSNQRAAADASFTGSREENPAARVQNSCLRIGKNRLLLWLDTEETGDPFFIQPSERSRVPWWNWRMPISATGEGCSLAQVIGITPP